MVFRSALINRKEELSDLWYFFTVKLGPDFKENTEMGVGKELIIKAIAKVAGQTPQQIKDSHKKTGDLGTIISNFKSDSPINRENHLSFSHVFSEFRKIANTHGVNSVNKKEDIIVELLE